MADRCSEAAPAGAARPGAPPEASGIRLPSIRALTRGIQLFVLLSVAAIVVGFWWKAPASARLLIRQLDWRYVALLPPLVFVDYLLGGLRYRALFDGRILTRVSLWHNMRANWANIFLGAATPFQTGGGPAQLYILWRCGARVSEGMLASLINFGGTLVFFLASSVTAILLLPSGLFPAGVTGLIRGGFGVLVLVILMVLAAMAFPHAALAVVRWVYDRLLARSRLARSRDHVIAGLEGGIVHFRDALRHTLRRGKGALLAIVALTLVLFFNKYTIGYVIVRALGQTVPYDVFLGLQCIQLGLIYFAPTPGASGVAEMSSIWLMTTVLPNELLVVYTVLWRFLTTVLGAIIGGGVLLLDMRRLAAQREPARADVA
jgi:uncharacterized protein (TIRG00374 family)